MSRSIKERLATSVFWLTWSRGGIQGLSFVTTLLVARLLDPADYGVMALAGLWTSTLGTLCGMGIRAAIIQFQDLAQEELNGLFWVTFGLSVIAYVFLLVLAPMIAQVFNNSTLSAVLPVVGLGLPLTSLRSVPESLLTKHMRFDQLSKAHLVASLTAIPVLVGLAWVDAGVWALVGSVLASSVAQMLMTTWFVRWRPTLAIGSKRFKEIRAFCLYKVGGDACWSLYQQADVLVLGKVTGATMVGFYSIAMQLVTLPVEKVFSLINEITFPIMSELQKDVSALRAFFERSLRLVSAVAFPTYAGLWLVGPDFISLLLTEKWAASAPILRLIVPYGVATSIAVLLPPLLLACYRADVVFRYTLAQLLVMPLAFWVGAEWWGGQGVALAWTLLYPLALLWLVRHALREVALSWSQALCVLKPAAAATLLMVMGVLAVKFVCGQWGCETSVLRLGIEIWVGVVLYVLALRIVAEPLLREIYEIVSWAMGRRGAIGRHSAES